tara:strand:- start:1391 stop:2323 length:933 start_codon:yes stop_codon:yes gene_type:complete
MEEFLWVERYRPKTVADTILPEDLKNTFEEFIKGGIPNLILSGGPGVGKTTVARAMLDQVGCDCIIINGSLYGNIDTLRNEIKNYASSVSLQGGRKYVILDEADYLNPQSTQPALRNFMEEYSNNCGFILTCNYKNRIIEPLHSRCSVVEFTIPNKQKPELAKQFLKRVKHMLDTENIEYTDKCVAELIMKYFPDWRRVINELQRYGSNGKIDAGVLTHVGDQSFAKLIQCLKSKQFNEMRKWVGDNVDNDCVALFRKIYDNCNEHVKDHTIPLLVTIIADYQYKSAFVADQEVNMVACLTQLMLECEFK